VSDSAPPSLLKVVLGWCVHTYTACGLLCAAAITLLLLQPERTPDTYRYCFIWMLIATVIDASDGTFARMVKIKETIPSFDGRRLDDLVDFLMYTCLPLLLIYQAHLLPNGCEWLLLVALFASAYGFSQSDIKTADGAFLGFPSYWNIVAFYFYAGQVNSYIAFGLIALFSVLTFVPSKYPYPTQPGAVNRIMLVLGCLWGVLLVFTVVETWEPELPRTLILTSMSYPALYMGYSLVHSVRNFILNKPDTLDD
jgi:phosphatidylcholine synthase